MNIIERLDFIIGLLDAGKSSAEIKGHLIAIREEIEAYAMSGRGGCDARVLQVLQISQIVAPL
jgi:hypothetical protein